MSDGAGSVDSATFSVPSGVLLAGPATAAGALSAPEAAAPLATGNCRRYRQGMWPFSGGKCRTRGEPQTGRRGVRAPGGARTGACVGVCLACVCAGPGGS